LMECNNSELNARKVLAGIRSLVTKDKELERRV